MLFLTQTQSEFFPCACEQMGGGLRAVTHSMCIWWGRISEHVAAREIKPTLVIPSPRDLFILYIYFPLGVWLAVRVPQFLHQFQALCVETVPLPTGHGLQQSLLFLGAAGGFQLVHSGQVEQDALVEIEGRVLLHQAFQLTQGLLQTAEVEQTHGGIVVGLRTEGEGNAG